MNIEQTPKLSYPAWYPLLIKRDVFNFHFKYYMKFGENESNHRALPPRNVDFKIEEYFERNNWKSFRVISISSMLNVHMVKPVV